MVYAASLDAAECGDREFSCRFHGEKIIQGPNDA
jgi:hypothetical protein